MRYLSTRSIITASTIVLSLVGGSGCSSSNSTHLAYVATGNGIFAYRINNNSGVASSIFSSPFVLGRSPADIVISPSKKFAYVSNQQDGTISLLKIDTSSGSLSEVLPRTNTGISPGPMIMDPAGSFLIVADQGSNDVSVFSVAADGTLTLASTTGLGASPSALALANGNLYVAVPNFSSIYGFSVSSGSLTALPAPFPVPNGVLSLTVDPAGNFLYAPNPQTDTITGFSIASGGGLSPLPTSPYGSTGTANLLSAPVAAVVDPSSKYLYAVNFASDLVSAFSISSTGDLTALTSSGASAGTNPAFIVFDPNQKYLFVGNAGSSSITELTMNSDGTLSSSNTIQVGTVPRALAFTD